MERVDWINGYRKIVVVATPEAAFRCIEVKTDGWALREKNVEGGLGFASGADDCPIIQIPGVQEEAWVLGFDAVDEGLEDEREEQDCKWVPLLSSGAA